MAPQPYGSGQDPIGLQEKAKDPRTPLAIERIVIYRDRVI
jgi:hypothetical protein